MPFGVQASLKQAATPVDVDRQITAAPIGRLRVGDALQLCFGEHDGNQGMPAREAPLDAAEEVIFHDAAPRLRTGF